MANDFRDSIYRSPFEMELRYLDRLYWVSILPFNMEAQLKTNWCWAATAKSVSRFYSRLTPWTQCKIASQELDKSCCDTPTPSDCNVPWYLDKALSRTQNFVSYKSGTATFNEIKEQLNQGLVIGTRIGWNGGGGHFMVIYGVSKILTNTYLYIDDPIYGKSVLTYNQFATNYQGAGTWTHTYFTKKKTYIMWLKDLVFHPSLLKVIPEVRPLARIPDLQREITRENLGEPEFFSAHHVYVLNLDKISERMDLPKEASSMRVMEFEENKPIAMYEVGINESNPQFLNLNMNKEYFQKFDYALNHLVNAIPEKEEGELRTIRIPALNLEVAWIHFENEESDRFMPLRLMEENGQKVFNKKSILEYINAQIRQLGKMDELMGA